jgi:uncharacterized protein YecE (DUF72 family)
MAKLRIGTCSWNYDSWVGLVYARKRPAAAEYLGEYAARFDSAEIDSWFYKLPTADEAADYARQAGPELRFTCKAFENLTLTHRRDFRNPAALAPNDQFLSPDLFRRYAEAASVLAPRLDALMFEFEYLNKAKMPSLDAFLDAFGRFRDAVGDEAAAAGLPLAVETRNANYLTEGYFRFLAERRLIPVLSEKQFLPHVWESYAKFRPLISGDVVIRLLGGDRKEIEAKTGQAWNAVVDEKPDKEKIVDMAIDLLNRGSSVTINVNNHYEGSAPLTAASLKIMFKARGLLV